MINDDAMSLPCPVNHLISSLWLYKLYEYVVKAMKAKVSVILAALLSISLAGAVFVNQNSGSLHFQKGIDFDCNENGYSEYLSQWTIEEKNTSRNTTSDEFKERVQYFTDNCVKIHEWNSKDKYK